jgi:hypothetical protein
LFLFTWGIKQLKPLVRVVMIVPVASSIGSTRSRMLGPDFILYVNSLVASIACDCMSAQFVPKDYKWWSTNPAITRCGRITTATIAIWSRGSDCDINTSVHVRVGCLSSRHRRVVVKKKKGTQLFFAILHLFSPRSIHWHHSGQRRPRQEWRQVASAIGRGRISWRYSASRFTQAKATPWRELSGFRGQDC